MNYSKDNFRFMHVPKKYFITHKKYNLDMHKRRKHKDIIQPQIQYQQPVQMQQQVQGGHDHYVQVQQARVHHPLDNQVQGLFFIKYFYFSSSNVRCIIKN